MKLLPILAVATLPLLAACGGDSTSPANTSVSGTLSFTHTGGGSPFSATGAIASTATSATQRSTQWAVGAKVSADNSVYLMANVPRSGGLADFAMLIVNRQTTGSGAIDVNCTTTSTTACNELVLTIGTAADGTSTTMCYLESGTMTLASISNSNATGSFSGAGTCFTTTTGASSVFTVTNGSFNVPLLANVPAS